MTGSARGRSASAALRADLLSQDKRRRSQRSDLASVSSLELPRRNDLLPRLSLESRAPDTLKAPKRNVRAIEPAHVKEVADSITLFGFSKPVLVDEGGNIIDGIVSVEAARLLGLPTIPCVVAGHLTPDERRLLRITVNKLGENGSWSFDELKTELEELVIAGQPIEVVGFELSQIDGLLSRDEEPVVEQGPVVPEPGRPVARIGDAFLLGRHRIVCGDARDPTVLHVLMGETTARMIFTDQPYNVAIMGNVTRGPHREFAMASGEMSDAEFETFNDAWIEAALVYLMDGGMFATFIDWRGLGSVTAAAWRADLSQVNLVVWGKTNAGMGSLYRSQHELLPIFKKGEVAHVNNVELGRKGRHRSNLWTYPGASTQGSDARQGLQYHPTVKPAAMLVEALYDLTQKGEVVLDPFLGSGSTLIACETAGRICRGVELDPLYIDVIVHRYEAATGQSAVLEGTGETFTALEQRRSSEKPDAGLAFDRAGDRVDLIGATMAEATIMDASIDDERLAEPPRSAGPPRVRVRKRP